MSTVAAILLCVALAVPTGARAAWLVGAGKGFTRRECHVDAVVAENCRRLGVVVDSRPAIRWMKCATL